MTETEHRAGLVNTRARHREVLTIDNLAENVTDTVTAHDHSTAACRSRRRIARDHRNHRETIDTLYRLHPGAPSTWHISGEYFRLRRVESHIDDRRRGETSLDARLSPSLQLFSLSLSLTRERKSARGTRSGERESAPSKIRPSWRANRARGSTKDTPNRVILTASRSTPARYFYRYVSVCLM